MSDEREKGKQQNNEVESLDHFSHRHPLTLKKMGWSVDCYGCRRFIRDGEMAYACREGCSDPTLHEECAEMPREIRLSMHPQHTLIIQMFCRYPYLPNRFKIFPKCEFCEENILGFSYCCDSSDRCKFQVHVGCAQNMEVISSCINHPSHPHQLTLLWKPGRSYSLRCDGCGTIEKGNSYMCLTCQYWIHESCAKLSDTAHYHHHIHPLSLAYHLPKEYGKYNFSCDICYKALLPRYWVYHCQTCRYVVHIKCAIKTSFPTRVLTDKDAAEDKDVVAFPISNVAEELIGSFVTKGGVLPILIEIISDKYKFKHHDHYLCLISTSLHDQQLQQEDDDDDDEFNCRDKSRLVCDGCTMPIFPKKKESSDAYYNYYMSCDECKYFLHWACFHLPPEIPSHPLHPYPNHNLTLQTRPKLDFIYCSVCYVYTNGFFYECPKCDFRVDIKCVSLPNTIKHVAHPHHHLMLLNPEITTNYRGSLCVACDHNTDRYACYTCDICQIVLHASCALLPAVITNRTWDKHPLPLTFDASVNHPDSFCCDVCEKEMNPKKWMYRCRTCDFSVHPNCFPTASGEYRNIKFGQRCVVASVHHHPIAYQLLTKKLNCDVCGRRKEYGCHGFQCDSDKCDFFMCLRYCAEDRLAEMQAVD